MICTSVNKLDRVNVVSLESLATQVNPENLGNLVILVGQENLGIQEDLVKMVLMETNITALSVPIYMDKLESLGTPENLDNVENQDLEDHPESLVMMLNAFLVSLGKMANPEGPDILEKMVYLENLAMMVALEIKLI